MSGTRLMKEPDLTQQGKIISTLTITWAQLLGVELSQIDISRPFIEMGAHSLLLLQATRTITDKFGVKIPFRAMLEEYPTITALADYIDQKLGPEQSTPDPPPQQSEVGGNGSSLHSRHESLPTDTVAHKPEESMRVLEKTLAIEKTPASEKMTASRSSIERILTQQLQVMSQQIEVLRQSQLGKQASPSQAYRGVADSKSDMPAASAQKPSNSRAVIKSSGPDVESQQAVFYEPVRASVTQLSPRQQEHLNELVARVTRRTQGSKQVAQDYRRYLADDRAISGFRLLWKEMQYPLISERADGSRLWDIDGNEYVDLTMGFGALLFGHSPSFIAEALEGQIKQGLQLGAESLFARKNAELICELTGTERVAFCNSGTEAVMMALRLARTVTGRSKIAIFEGCYHGTFDGVLVRPERTEDGKSYAAPMAPGVPNHMIDNVVLLRFNDMESLTTLKEHADELAAVLLEPLPSRMPGARPKEFLHELRKLTEQAGVALIFDEVVSGFRFHIGGAQALFGVQADLVTYGKAVGGGMPVGVVAGKATYMDSIDGGMWNYGDRTYPQAETTFCAGTYFKHPFIMPALWAALNHLKDNTPALHEQINQNTALLARTLNAYFESERVLIRVSHFGSLFRFLLSPKLLYKDLFYYHLLDKGVYVCETRTCYLSTAHTQEDIDFVVEAVKATVDEMRKGELLPIASSPTVSDAIKKNGGAGESAKAIGVDAGGESKESFRVPLTEAQKYLWLEAKMGDDASRAYNEPIVQLVPGQFDVSEIRKAIQHLVDRHEALRTTFSPQGDYQLVHARLSIDAPLIDFSHLENNERALRVREWMEKEAQQVFDLEKGPLMRVRIAKLAENSHLLSLTIHHLITDGWSNEVLLNELGALCFAYRAKTVCRLPEPMQFSEYARWQAGLQEGAQMAEDEAYWLDQLAGPAPPLQLPTVNPRSPLRTYNGAREYMNVDTPVYEDLKKVAGQQGCTLFMLLLSGFSALMHRLSGQDDLVIGIPSAGQSLVGNRPLIGYCVNLVPFRSRVINNPTFASYLTSTRRVLLDAYEHQNYPFGRLINKLDIPRDPGRPTLVTVIFNLDKAGPRPAIPGMELGAITKPGRSSKFDITLDITETARGLKAEWEFNTDLFDAETIRRWAGYFHTMLNAIVADPQQPLSELEILSEAERHQLLVEWNDTHRDYAGHKRIQDLFEEHAEQTPDRVALVYEGQQVTYGELNRRANQLGHYLRSMGVKPDELIGICMERNVEMIVGLLGILKAGGAYVPLDPEYPKQRLDFILRDANVSLILSMEELEIELSRQQTTLIKLDSDWKKISSQSEANCESDVTSDNLAYIIYTSGSTGTPKGVAIQHKSAVTFLNWARDAFSPVASQSVLASTSICFDLSIFELFGTMSWGGRVVLTKNVMQLAEAEAREEVRLINTVPSAMSELIRMGSVPRSVLRVNLAGEALSNSLVQEIYGLGQVEEVYNLYGPSEDTTYSTYGLMGRSEGQRVTIGRPVANTRVYILDKQMMPVPVGVAGEIYIGGEGLARCYYDRAEMTAEKFVPSAFGDKTGSRVYKTGDLGRYLSDGEIEYLGRADEQVKLRGYRIEPGEIEALLEGEADIREALVIARQDEGEEKRLVAYLVCEDQNNAPAVSELRRRLKQKLPDYMIPTAFVMMEKMPLNANGKVDRKALPPPERIRPEMEKAYAEPLTSVERMLTGIWAQTLGIDKIGVHDNFFDLGGDSILGMRIITKANQAGLHLAPQQIFQYQTISELARAAGTIPGVQAEQGEVTGPIRFIPILHWFFEQALPEPHHFNLSNLFEIPQHLDPALLERAVEHLLAHHDALRLRRVSTDSDKQLVIVGVGGDTPFSREDLSSLSDSEQKAVLASRAAELQASLDLSKGPLLRVALFDLGAQKPNWLLIIIHHLAVDIVSWPILVEDLLAAYRQLSRGGPVELPLKTTSFKQWAERLTEYARSTQLKQELSYWLSEPRQRVVRLPVDYAGGDNTEGSTSTLSMSLSAEETRALIHEVPRVSRTQIQETLLTALAQAFARLTGRRSLLVDVESHGREALFEDIDLSRTVGWFTSIVPVMLDLEQALTVEDALKSVKEQLRSIPNGGIGYGLLRYMSGDSEIAEKMRTLARAEVCFNYMGQMSRGPRKTSLIGTAKESIGSPRSPRGTRLYLLDVNVTVSEGVLQAHWTYSENVHQRSTVEGLASGFIEALRSLISRCLSRESVSYTPSDFPLAKLDEQKLSRLAKLIDKTGKSATTKQRAVSVSLEELVKVEPPEPGRTIPLIVQPNLEGVDLVAWATNNRAFIDTNLLKHGAILFRNFKVKTAAEFGQFIKAVSGEIMQYRERSSPRSEVDDRIYTSTDYPAEQSIFPHNENSYAQTFPLKLGFFCVTPAREGGETLIGDCRRVLNRLDPDIRERFTEKKWMYVRNFGNGFGLGWEEVFQTKDRAVVEQYCHKNGIEFEWKDGNQLRTRQIRSAVTRHPRTSEMVWFNHAAFFHVTTLDPAISKELLAAFEEEDLPNNTFYGDGSRIEPVVLEKIREAYMEEMVAVRWQKGDLVVLDNILTAHARAPFVGPRKILFAMSEPFAREDS